MVEEHGHILVVDDNRTNRIKLTRSLERQGHTVDTAEDGEHALQKLKSSPFDVVLLDIIMPVMDGFEVLERIKGDPDLRDIPVIVISALDETESAVRCIENGAEDFLPKTFDPVLLRARLNSSLGKKKLRDLEKAYLEQEMTLHQNEKLATLGKLSAGMAHELNNPAAAAQRGAAQIGTSFDTLQRTGLQMSAMQFTTEQLEQLSALDDIAKERVNAGADIDPITRSDREAELESWLDDLGIQDAWQLTSSLVDIDFRAAEYAALLSSFETQQLPVVLEWFNCAYTIYSLLDEVGQGAGRISEIVRALKAYTYLDQAPVQKIDVHEGIDSTLVILQSKLQERVQISRTYADDLPLIEAYGSELNQVWTNLIDNAVDAINGEGEIRITTRRNGAGVIVEIQDSGSGIPSEIMPKIFDPFFTTKPVGQGAGLGLNTVHNIINKHNGRIDVQSGPGNTLFEIQLPEQLESRE